MRRLAPFLIFAAACGPSLQPDPIKTPDELLAEQEALGEAQVRQSETSDNGVVAEELDSEKKKQFDEKQTELELKRASRSAATCSGVVTEATAGGAAKVTLTFSNDGHVKESSIAAPYTDTAMGKCVLRAMAAVIVPPYIGAEVTKEWEVDVSAKAN